MKKNKQQLEKRKEFILKAINDPLEFAEYLEEEARKIRALGKPNIVQMVSITSDLLFLSPQTVVNVLYR